MTETRTNPARVELLEEVIQVYWLALNKISGDVGRQSREMRIARQALKDATYLRMAADPEGNPSVE